MRRSAKRRIPVVTGRRRQRNLVPILVERGFADGFAGGAVPAGGVGDVALDSVTAGVNPAPAQSQADRARVWGRTGRRRCAIAPPRSAGLARGVFGLGGVARNRSSHARQAEGILDGEGSLHQAQHGGLDPDFLALAREPLFAEIDRFQNRAGAGGRVVHGRAGRVGRRDLEGGIRHRFVPIVFAGGLGGDAVAHSRLQIGERQAGGHAGIPESVDLSWRLSTLARAAMAVRASLGGASRRARGREAERVAGAGSRAPHCFRGTRRGRRRPARRSGAVSLKSRLRAGSGARRLGRACGGLDMARGGRHARGMEHAPAIDTLRFARTLVDAGVERRHAKAHAKAASAAIGAATMKTASAEGLRAVGDWIDGVENRLGRLERRLDGLYRASWLRAAGIVVAVVALVKLLPSPWPIRVAEGGAMRELSSATGGRSRLRNAPMETIT